MDTEHRHDPKLEHIMQSNPIVEVAVELGLRLRANVGPCFRTGRHADADPPTLFFNVAKNTFLCRTCSDVGGDVIDFVCQYKGWERQKAIEWLIHRIEFDRETRMKYYNRGKKKE
jgi:hypothetical protein